MQTPISFALDILLDCDTIEKAHKLARRYIKVMEACGTQPAPKYANNAVQPTQAASTQRLLEQHGLAQVTAAPTAAPIIPRNAGAEVSNGDGTRGRKKW